MSKFKITYTATEGKLTVKNVTVREPLVEDMIEAQKQTDSTKMSAALLSLLCTFDGKKLTMEDVEKLPLADFLELSTALTAEGLLGSKELLSTLSEKGDLATKA